MVYGDGPSKVIERVGDNTYKLKLSSDINVNATFNVRELTPYVEDDFEDFKENSFSRG